ncbi:hypothetical protein D3C87_1729940 [compost metagenome]
MESARVTPQSSVNATTGSKRCRLAKDIVRRSLPDTGVNGASEAANGVVAAETGNAAASVESASAAALPGPPVMASDMGGTGRIGGSSAAAW